MASNATPCEHARAHPVRERAWVEVDTGALLRNYRQLRAVAGPGVKLVPMVKADGYGLGARRVVEALAPADPYGFGVATVDEGLALRRAGVHAPVMICGPAPPGALGRAVEGRLIPTVSDIGTLDALEALAAARGSCGRGVPARRNATAPRRSTTVPFQVEVDTGMGRAGFPLAGAVGDWWPRVLAAAADGLRLIGVYTHLHSADEADLASARRQVERFRDFVHAVEGIGPDTLVHFANSAGVLRLPQGFANAARPGIYLYGGRPGPVTVPPEPVAAVRARIVLVRQVPAGATASYGATYKARRPECWATVAIGYGDGLPRALGNRGRALAGGRTHPIVGRVTMDMTVLRLNDAANPSPGDAVTFIGRDGDAAIGLHEVAALANTIDYEILTGLSPRLPRTTKEP